MDKTSRHHIFLCISGLDGTGSERIPIYSSSRELLPFVKKCFRDCAYIGLGDLLMKLENMFGAPNFQEPWVGQRFASASSDFSEESASDIELVSPRIGNIILGSPCKLRNIQVSMKIPKGYASCIQCQGNGSSCPLCNGSHLILKSDVAKILGRS